jgi:hypothetical protein
MALHFFETSVAIYQSAGRKIPKYLNLLLPVCPFPYHTFLRNILNNGKNYKGTTVAVFNLTRTYEVWDSGGIFSPHSQLRH